VLGEVVMGLTTRWTLKLLSREANATPGPLPDHLLDSAVAHFDQGTQRAILRLYRSAPADVLAAAGRDLGRLECPALVVWGARDPYIPVAMAHAYGEALPHATVRVVEDAGHWPWLDRPELVGEIAAFLAG
jgi:pimeloyl-ACP methyl ester carboxylesterase